MPGKPDKITAHGDNPAKPAVWTDCPTHAVLIEHPDGRILWDTSCPRDWEQRWAPTSFSAPFQGVTLLQSPGHTPDPDQIHELRIAPAGSYS